jgi:hypothetical protein
MSQVNITLNTNTVDINTTNNQIVVTDPTNPTTVNITQPITSVVEVITAGPQGAQGPQGLPGPSGSTVNTGSFVTTSSFNSFTSSYNTGSFTGSFIGNLIGSASFSTSASFANNSTSASYSVTSSFANTATSASYALSSSFAISSSAAVSSSFSTSASFAQTSSIVQSIANNITNNVDNYVLTATGGSSINGEANLTFDGSLLKIRGNLEQGSLDVDAQSEGSHAEGRRTIALGAFSHAEGQDTETGIQTAFSTDRTEVVDGLVILAGDATGYFTPGGYLYLYDANLNSGWTSHLIDTVNFEGDATLIQLLDTTVNATLALVGDLTYLQNNRTFGGENKLPGPYAHSEGFQTKAMGQYSHAEGAFSYALGQYSHAEGRDTQAIGTYSHAEGRGSRAIGFYSHAEGDTTIASGSYSHAEGTNTQAKGNYSHAEGQETISSGSYSHAEGYSTISLGSYSHAEGTGTQAIGNYSHAEGESTIAYGDYSHAEGLNTIASGSNSHAEGVSTIAKGSYSHAEGVGAIAYGNWSHAEGDYTIASGSYSHAEGESTIASGSYSHAEGESTRAQGIGAHAEGLSTQAIENYSHAEGNSAIASGTYSHAEGQNTRAIGNFSHAEGDSTTAQGNGSHAEGVATISVGLNSHAEGLLTSASANYSHAEGQQTQARGEASHAEGLGTVALGSYQHVQGQYNISSSVQSAFIIGNGTSPSSRSNLVFTSGSTFQVTGSVIATQGFTGSLFGTSSWALNSTTSSFAATASFAPAYLPISGGTISGSLVIQNNLTVLGSASIQFISESTLNIGTNLITVNTINPGARFGGLAVIDSGSSPQVSASFLYDSVQDEFIFVHRGTSTSAITSSHFVLGPETYNNLGNETYLTANRIPKGVGNEHLNDSNISDNGSVVSINSNSEITGSLTVTQGITGSLFGTSSFASTASLAPAYLPIAVPQTTGLVISFTQDRVYGTLASPETGSAITSNTASAILGVTNLIIHSASAAPTTGSDFKKLTGSSNYVAGVNYIYCTYIANNQIIYSISQAT